MSVKMINILEAKNKLSGLISNVEKKGMSYIICRDGKPVAEIVGHKSKDRLRKHPDLYVKIKGKLFDDDMSEDWECLR